MRRLHVNMTGHGKGTVTDLDTGKPIECSNIKIECGVDCINRATLTVLLDEVIVEGEHAVEYIGVTKLMRDDGGIRKTKLTRDQYDAVFNEDMEVGR